jgi:integrase
VLTENEYKAVLGIANQMDWRFKVALILAYETGHRIGAIRQLRWSDIDLEGGNVRWRAEHEKTGYEHVTPLTLDAKAALGDARRMNPGIGDAPMFPADRNPGQAIDRFLPRKWWEGAEKLAGLDAKKGRGWHSIRRKFATDLMDQPLRVVCKLGGWKTHETLLECYQQPNEGRMRQALAARRGASGGAQ